MTTGIITPENIGLTPGALDFAGLSDEHARFVADAIARHLRGDWGDIDDEDRAANDWALLAGGRVLSAYRVPESLADDARAAGHGGYGDGPVLWVHTDGNRVETLAMWPDEY